MSEPQALTNDDLLWIIGQKEAMLLLVTIQARVLISDNEQLSTDSAAKPTTNTWTIASDANMKDASKQRPYERGLDLIRALPTPHYWTYNGKADTPEGVESMGWNAQDLEVIAPKMVRKTRGKLTPAREKRVNEKGDVELLPVPKEIVDALPETDLLGVNNHELIFAMFNAIRELDASVKALKEKP